jgi:hypothetical protein
MRMSADVIQCEYALAGVTDYDFAAFQDARLHASLRNLGQCHNRHERSVGHFFLGLRPTFLRVEATRSI